ncbi:hypothetical protein PRK78_005507 [Emydomyces testavorans]|uniref:Uncharacterized protein n=1 Tax=Emydomyces testavorans TaxID=2070801 RepID=A0AAF0DJP2_9EURO|nr:hypothetical protein PRK78_005507 [Emydomyces testavorans]
MSREETRFNLDISAENARKLQEQGRDSQKKRGLVKGQKPSSTGPDQLKLPNDDEEEMMRRSALESQKRLEKKAAK